MDFKVLHKDKSTNARAGIISTERGSVKTPVFMPVATRGTVRALTNRDIEEIGFEIILSNTYHQFIRPGLEILKKAGGLHNFMNYQKPILTDSGGFQVFSLSDLCKVFNEGVEFRSHLDGSIHFFSPEMVLEIQKVLGSDIMMVLDQCVHYPSPYDAVREAMEKTVNWAGISYNYWQSEFDSGKQALFAISQGGIYRDLRDECIERLLKYDFSGYAIGGLSVGEPKEEYRNITELVLKKLPEDKPRYMMGVGSPPEILFAIMHGVDMFDCVMPTRIARNGTLYTSKGRINIKSSVYTEDFSPLDDNCECYVCKNFSRSYLRHIFKMGEISSLIYNSYHNLFFMKKFLDEIRNSIIEGNFMSINAKWEEIYKN